MALTVRKILLWRREAPDAPGVGAATLEPFARSGADLKLVMGYRIHDGKAAVEVWPVAGRKIVQSLREPASSRRPSPRSFWRATTGPASAMPSRRPSPTPESTCRSWWRWSSGGSSRRVFGFGSEADAKAAAAILRKAGAGRGRRGSRRRASARPATRPRSRGRGSTRAGRRTRRRRRSATCRGRGAPPDRDRLEGPTIAALMWPPRCRPPGRSPAVVRLHEAREGSRRSRRRIGSSFSLIVTTAVASGVKTARRSRAPALADGGFHLQRDARTSNFAEVWSMNMRMIGQAGRSRYYNATSFRPISLGGSPSPRAKSDIHGTPLDQNQEALPHDEFLQLASLRGTWFHFSIPRSPSIVTSPRNPQSLMRTSRPS